MLIGNISNQFKVTETKLTSLVTIDHECILPKVKNKIVQHTMMAIINSATNYMQTLTILS